MEPQAIQNKEAELEELVTKYPDSIPIEVLGRFLKLDPNCLRVWAMSNPNNPFAIGIAGEDGKHGYTRALTTPFYKWYTKKG